LGGSAVGGEPFNTLAIARQIYDLTRRIDRGKQYVGACSSNPLFLSDNIGLVGIVD
jgi:hypothetical protein